MNRGDRQDWLFHWFSIFLTIISLLWNPIKNGFSAAWDHCKNPVFFMQQAGFFSREQLEDLPEKPKCSVIPGLKNRVHKPTKKVQEILDKNYESKLERLRLFEKQNYLCRMYKTFQFQRVYLLKATETDKISCSEDISESCDNSAERVHDFKVILKTKEIFQKFLEHASQGINPQPYLREHLANFIISINNIIQNHGICNFPIIKDSKTSDLLECCWKVGDGRNERYLEVKLFEKPTEIGGLVFHEVVSICVIGKKRFRSYYHRTKEAALDNYRFVLQDDISARLLKLESLDSILEAEKNRLENTPWSYWHVEEGTKITGSMQPIHGSNNFFHSQFAPSPNAFLIKFDDILKARSLEELKEQYYKQKPADLICDEDYEPLENSPQDNICWNEWVEQEILENPIKEKDNNNVVKNQILLMDFPISITYKLDSRDEGPYHILIRHWDQFEIFLEVQKRESRIGRKLFYLYTLILQQQKEEDGFDEDLDQDPKIVELEERIRKISDNNRELLTSLQRKLIHRLPQLLEHQNCSGGLFKSSYNTNMVLKYQISYGEDRERCLYVIISVDKIHGYSLRTAYFVAPQESKLAFDELRYWYDMENGKIVVRNRRDFKNSSGFDIEDQSVFTSPIVVKRSSTSVHPYQLRFNACEYKEVISMLFLSKSLLSTDKNENYVITGISKELIAMIRKNITDTGAKMGGAEIRAPAIEFNLECNRENEESLKENAKSTIKQIMSTDNLIGNITRKTGEKVEFYLLKKAKWVLICSKKKKNGSEEIQKFICFKTWKEVESLV